MNSPDQPFREGTTPGLRGESRRSFLKRTGTVAAALAGAKLTALASENRPKEPADRGAEPWFRRALRWGQTNITELDPTRYDVPWWRDYWKRTEVQGVIINAGGIVAYYPSKFPLHRRAEFLGQRDLFGTLAAAAHEQGIAVLARMDSGGANEEFYRAHPDWFTVDSSGKPHRSRDLYVTCINGPYYREYIPALLQEIAERYHPEGFTDNSWSGLGRNSICHCENCTRKFREASGQPLPLETNWDDLVYRQWIRWSYATRLEIWDLNNRTTRAAGGRDCLWVGMNSGSIIGQCQSFRDYKEICAHSEIILLDHQSRNDTSGFQNNGETGKLIHQLLGWDKLIPESMALYQAGRPTFRFSAKPEPEARMWILDGFAGGIQPWWHHLGAWQEDRRAFHIMEPINRWHRANQQFLVNRNPIATVGVVWSQQNCDFYGRDDADLLVEQPWRGMTAALIRARIPYLPVHVDQIERDAKQLAVLILPNLAGLTDRQAATVRQFVERGGGLLATGESSLRNEWGEARPDFALGDLFGAHALEKPPEDRIRRKWASETQHTYLRLPAPPLAPFSLSPSQGERVGERGPSARFWRNPQHAPTNPRPMPGGAPDSPKAGLSGAGRHAVLSGFEETDIIGFGGELEPLRLDASAQVLLTFVPPFPVYPPESVWMREPRTTIPGLILNERGQSGRVAFLTADLDRRFARDNLPDHGDLLANLVRWLARENFPLSIEGPGLIDCHLYQQPGRLILHLVNLTSAGTWRAPIHELVPVGPLRIKVKLPANVRAKSLSFLVAGRKKPGAVKAGWVSFEINSLLDHEVVVIG